MKSRTRKMIGIPATVAFLIIYALVAMAIGGIFAVGQGVVYELVVFILLGLGWLPVAMLLVKWMSKPDAPEDAG